MSELFDRLLETQSTNQRDARIRELENQVAEFSKSNEIYRNRLTCIVRWLEENEKSVFQRGIWDATWGNWEFNAGNWRTVAEGLAAALEEIDIGDGQCINSYGGCGRECAVFARKALDTYNKAKAEEGR
jgi:hypothetical protein